MKAAAASELAAVVIFLITEMAFEFFSKLLLSQRNEIDKLGRDKKCCRCTLIVQTSFTTEAYTDVILLKHIR